MITIKSSNIKFREKFIKEYETAIGFKIPSEYLKFLRKYNGGFPEPNVLDLNSGEFVSISINAFFGIGVEEDYNLLDKYKTFINRIPNGNLPIAHAEGGNIICINVENGKVLLWDRDTELIDDISVIKPGDNNDTKEVKLNEIIECNPLILISYSFNEFIDKIKPDETILNEDNYEVLDIWIDEDFLKEMKKQGNLIED